MNILMLLQMAADAMGERVAVQCNGGSLSYRELHEAASRAGQRWRHNGGRYVAYLDTASLATPITLFGAAAAGLPYVPLNYRLTPAELDALLARIEPCYLVTGSERLPDFRNRNGVQALATGDLLAAATADTAVAEPAASEPEDIAVQLFTSGTTGQPKAAVLRHSHLVSYILGSVDFAAAAEEEAVLVTVPPYHIAGISALISATYTGRRVVMLPAFDPESWLALARSEQVTHAFLVPTMLARIVEQLQKCGAGDAGLPTLRALAYGGGKMPQGVIEAALRLFPGVDFTNAYGLTETSSTITLLGPDDHRAASASENPATRRRLASVGRALPGIELQIRDDAGGILPAGAHGEVYVRGPQVSGEYVGKGSQLDPDGWFPTRDAGFLDTEGYLFLEGRADDVIVRGGENISPGEVEDVLLTHPAVAEAAVVGMPSEQWGEAVAAAVITRSGMTVDTTSLQQHVRDALRSSRVPERILFVEALPYNEMGKLLRRQIREWLMP